jgi:peptidoglycan/LPS O-acetylase OafA/YrhL
MQVPIALAANYIAVSPSAAKSYRPDIDGLRAVAVIGVVAFHAAPRLLPGGFVGVDVFFVISGYLISGLILAEIEQGAFSFLNFYRRRIRRILPALVLVTAATWLIGLFVLWPRQFADLGAHILAASVFCSNILLTIQTGYFEAAADTKPLLHLWSLAIEEQFYLIWPVMLLVAWKYRLNLAAVFCLILVASFASGAAILASHPAWAFYGLPGRAWELAIGALLALRRGSEFVPQPMRSAAAVAGLFLIVMSMLLLNDASPYPGWRALPPTIGAASLIFAGSHSVVGRLLSAKPVVAVGLISYPLYLWHWPLLAFSRVAHVNSTPFVAAADVVCAALLAWLTYRIIELPIRTCPSIALNRYAPAGLIVLLIGMGMLGAGTQWSNGLAFRLNVDVRELDSFQFDYNQAYRGETCLLSADQGERNFAGDCVEATSAPLLLLWGDSHAAHLYPGLKALQTSVPSFSLAQFTANACPPIIDIDVVVHPHCRQINSFIAGEARRLRPKVAVLAASWWAYPDIDLTKLRRTVDKLREDGVDSIILVGPVPVWNPSLPAALLSYYSKNFDIPIRMDAGLTRMTDIDTRLRKMASWWGITYFSPLDAMCDAGGCLTRTSNDMRDLVAWDSAHLTLAGSRFLAGKMPLLEAIQTSSRLAPFAR